MKTHYFEFVQSDATGYQLELLIRQYGIRTFDRRADGKRISFSVPAAQAKWAKYLFDCVGVTPISAAVPGSKPDATPRYEPKPLPTAWGVGVKRRDLSTIWIDFLAMILGAPHRGSWQAKTKGDRR